MNTNENGRVAKVAKNAKNQKNALKTLIYQGFSAFGGKKVAKNATAGNPYAPRVSSVWRQKNRKKTNFSLPSPQKKVKK